MTIETDTEPPVAPRKPSVRDLHGERAVDDYAWMRNPGEPALREHLAAERAYYGATSRHLQAFVDALAGETLAQFPAADEYSVPWHVGGYTYRTRLPEHSDDVQLLRSRDPDTEETVLLDENLVAARTGFVEVGMREPSPDGALLAWSADTTGAEVFELRIRDLSSGEDLPEVIFPSYRGVAWSTDSGYLFYLVANELFRPFQVWRHRVGAPAEDDELVYEEGDARFDMTLCGARSGEVAFITSESRDTTEVRLVDLTAPLSEAVLVAPRERGIEYRVDQARGGTLYMVTNVGAEEFTLMRAPVGCSTRDAWEQVSCESIAPAREDTRLVRCDVFADQLVLSVRRHGAQLLVITDHDGGNAREIEPSPAAGSISVAHGEDYDRGSVIICEESLIEPPAWSELALTSGSKQALKRLEVPGYDAGRYRTERLMAPARDGTPIPVTIAHREDIPLDGSAPCLLYGYGAYEATIDPEFHRALPSLLDRGVVYAVAHIRGGGECGRRWWLQGRLRNKPTTFTDYIDVADWLAGDGADGAAGEGGSPVDGGEGRPLVDGSRIVTRGASAGGLLQGAVFSMRPTRWRAVVAEVPFVDCVNTMLDASIPLTVNEWDEWGDPRDPGDYACMRSYSPYDNPPDGDRPALLVTGAVNDPRVGIHEPAKWVALLRSTDDGRAPLLFRPELGVGAHSGPSGRTARLRYEAEIQAFILEAMGITE